MESLKPDPAIVGIRIKLKNKAKIKKKTVLVFFWFFGSEAKKQNLKNIEFVAKRAPIQE